jgi:hypothetical protein
MSTEEKKPSKPIDQEKPKDKWEEALAKSKWIRPASDKDRAGFIITGVTTKPKPKDKKD